MTEQAPIDLSGILPLLPSLPCVMSSAYERRRAGVLVRWVMQCATEPVLICVAARKGHSVAPLIRDSHSFALSLIDPHERVLLRKFDERCPVPGDPFDSIEIAPLVTGAPTLLRSRAAMDLDVVRHFDLEDADHELYVGRVLGVRVGQA